MRLFSLVPTKTEDGTSLIKIIIPVVLVFVVSIVVIVLYCRCCRPRCQDPPVKNNKVHTYCQRNLAFEPGT
ncbi:hypothetical protein ABFA07_011319 [Porites harrisoni]